MSEQHPPAAISGEGGWLVRLDTVVVTRLPLQTQRVQSVSLLILGLEEAEISLPLVPDHFATGETSDGNYHDDEGTFLKYFYLFISSSV